MLGNMEPKSVALGASPNFSSPLEGNNLSVLRKRNLQATPLRMPVDRSGCETRGREAETLKPDSEYDNSEGRADKSSISLITLIDVCESGDTRQAVIESTDQATLPSLISYSQEQGLGDSVGSLFNPILQIVKTRTLIQILLRNRRVLFRTRDSMVSG